MNEKNQAPEGAQPATPAGFTPDDWTRRVLRHSLEAIEAGASASLVMNVEGVKDNIRSLLNAPAAPAAFDAAGFRSWVLANLPDETVIGSSAWWADHLTAWAGRFVKVAPAPAEGEGPRDLRDAALLGYYLGATADDPQPKGTAAQAKPEAFDSEGMRKLATIVTPFAGEAILQCVDEVDRLRAAQAAPAPALTDMQIDKLLHALDDVALNFGDDLPGLALNSRGLERSRAVVRRAFASPAPAPGGTAEAVHIRLLRDFLDSLPANLGSTRRIELRDGVKRMLDEGWFRAPAVVAENDTAEFEVWEGDELYASASGPRDQAWAEVLRYADQCYGAGVVRVFEVSRVERTVDESDVPVQQTGGVND